jgi:hypothetical protein
MRKLRTRATILLLAVCILTLSGCGAKDWADLIDIGKLWLTAHGLADSQGNPDKVAIVKGTILGTGDPETDAVLEAGQVIKNYQEAEKLFDEGMNDAYTKKDFTKIDAAINLRPGEYRYHSQRGMANMKNGNYDAALKDFDEGDALAAKFGKSAQLQANDTRIYSLQTYGSSVDGEKERLKALSEAYQQRYQISNDPKDKQTAEQYSQESANTTN